MIKYNRRTLGDFYTTILNHFDVPAQAFGWNKGSLKGMPYNNGAMTDWG